MNTDYVNYFSLQMVTEHIPKLKFNTLKIWVFSVLINSRLSFFVPIDFIDGNLYLELTVLVVLLTLVGTFMALQGFCCIRSRV